MYVISRNFAVIAAFTIGLVACGGGSGGNAVVTSSDTSTSIVTPITATCSQSNFTLENFNAIAVGMTLEQVTQAIGCQSNSNGVTSSFKTYGWGYGSSLINVQFDPTGTTVTKFGDQYKTAVNLNMPSTPAIAACNQSNFTLENFNAIAVGMTLEQVTQAIGCQSNSNAVTSSFVTYGWGYGSSLINVQFDPTGTTATKFGDQYKTAVNLN